MKKLSKKLNNLIDRKNKYVSNLKKWTQKYKLSIGENICSKCYWKGLK